MHYQMPCSLDYSSSRMNITQHDGSRVCSNIKDNARFVTFKRLVHAIFRGVGLQKTQQFNILCSVFEDNVGALSLETLDLPQMTPRFKHYAVKYHCFRACLKPENIRVLKVESKQQLAEIFTMGCLRVHLKTSKNYSWVGSQVAT